MTLGDAVAVAEASTVWVIVVGLDSMMVVGGSKTVVGLGSKTVVTSGGTVETTTMVVLEAA